MAEVGVYEAKAKLSALLDQVEQGGSVTITRHGRPVARLVPIARGAEDVRTAIAELRNFRRGRLLGSQIGIRELIEEGRR
jgi:prevent-host-death family protein